MNNQPPAPPRCSPDLASRSAACLGGNVDSITDIMARSLRSAGAAATDELISERLIRKRARDEQPSRTVVRKCEETALHQPEETCPICLCGLSDPDAGASGTTVCGHKFHLSCLSTWMAMDQRHTCPECRSYLGGSASRSRMFVAEGAQRQPRRSDDKRMPRFHGG